MSPHRFTVFGAVAGASGVARAHSPDGTNARRLLDAAIARCGDPARAVPAEGARFCLATGDGRYVLGLAISSVDRGGARAPLVACTAAPVDDPLEHAAIPAVLGPHVVSWRAAMRAGAARSLPAVERRLEAIPAIDPRPLREVACTLRTFGVLEHATRLSFLGREAAPWVVEQLRHAARAARNGRGPTLVVPIGSGRELTHLLALVATVRAAWAAPPSFAWTSERAAIALGAPAALLRALRAGPDAPGTWSLLPSAPLDLARRTS
jgi:hypothetical protein